MVSVLSLWLPILVAAVIVHVLSFLAWVVLPHHKKEYTGMANEDAFLENMRADGVAPGQYMFPHCAPGDKTAMERWKRGPNGVLFVWKGPGSMGRKLGLSFAFYLAVSIFVGYLTGLARPMGADFIEVFRVAGAAAILGYGMGSIPHSIWFGHTLRSIVTVFVDAIVYGLATAAVFAWLWPAAEMI